MQFCCCCSRRSFWKHIFPLQIKPFAIDKPIDITQLHWTQRTTEYACFPWIFINHRCLQSGNWLKSTHSALGLTPFTPNRTTLSFNDDVPNRFVTISATICSHNLFALMINTGYLHRNIYKPTTGLDWKRFPLPFKTI